MRNRWIGAVALSVAVALGALTGCSSEEPGGGAFQGQDATEVHASAAQAFQAATSVRVQGSLALDGGEVTTLDLRLTQGGDAHVAVGSGGISLEMIRIGDQAWFRSPQAWSQVSQEVAAAIGDRWVLVTPGSGTDQFIGATESFADMRTFGEQFLASPSQLEKVEGETVEGVPTVGLRDHEGVTMHISAEGEPYPLLITPATEQDQSQRLTFSDYNSDLGIAAPADAITDITSLIANTLAG
jgi:hypothetical protein